MPSKKKSTTNFFPAKLHNLLENAEKRGYDKVVSWQEGGNSFRVWDSEVFVKTIMPKYFKQTKLKSFQRQLNIYGWKRIGTGKNRGGYFHPSFVRGIPELCLLLKRAPIPGDGKQNDPPSSTIDSTPIPLAEVVGQTPAFAKCNTTSSPGFGVGGTSLFGMGDSFMRFQTKNPPTGNFATVPQLPKDLYPGFVSSYTGHHQEPEEDPFGVRGLDGFGHAPSSRFNRSTAPRIFVGGQGRMTEDMHLFANIFSGQEFDHKMEQDDNSLFENQFAAMNSKKESSMMPSLVAEAPRSSHGGAQGACENVFPQKLHYLLQQAETEGFDHIVSWVNDGAAFKVHDSKAFLETVMPNYFDQSKYESFRRQLNLYGFQRVSRGCDRGIYYHQFFLQSEPTLCQSITRPASTSSSSTSATNTQHMTSIKC